MPEKIEIKYISPTEMQIEQNKVFLIENRIIHIIAIGEQTVEIADAHLELNQQLFEKIKGKVSFMVDLNKSGKNSTEARQIWKQIGEMEKTHKVAVFGMHPVAKVIASFYMGMTNSKNVRFFKTMEESKQWLDE